MRQKLDLRTVMVALAAAVFAVGCASTQSTPPPSPPGDAGQTQAPPEPRRPIEGTQIPEPSPEFETIYFDFDKSEIRADMRSRVRENADLIRGHSAWRSVTIEGHCDERGSEEYNLALGERRANSVKSYLVNLGISSNRLDTVSFGEERPAVQGHDESAWRWNRRAEFGINE